MHLNRYPIEAPAYVSDLIEAGGGAAVVDLKFDVEDFLAEVTAQGLRHVTMLDSHPYADCAHRREN